MTKQKTIIYSGNDLFKINFGLYGFESINFNDSQEAILKEFKLNYEDLLKKMVKKIYKKLTIEQKNKDIVFSSCLSVFKTEQLNDKIHEVFKNDPNKDIQIKRLKDDSFFNNSHFKFNIIRK